MDSDRKTKSFSLESPEPEDLSSTKNTSAHTASSVTDVSKLEDDDYKALLEESIKANYQKRNGNVDKISDTGQTPTIPATETSLSKDAQNIFAVLKEAADREIREDEAADVSFGQKKLGKSASHESCQSKSTRSFYGRHSAFNQSFNASAGVEVDAAFSSCLFGTKTQDQTGSTNRNNSQLFPSRNSATSLPKSDNTNCGCRSPGSMVTSKQRIDSGQEHQNQNNQRGLNRSYSSTGGGGGGGTQWTSTNNRDSNEQSDLNAATGDSLDEDASNLHSLIAKSLNNNNNSDRFFTEFDSGLSRSNINSTAGGNRTSTNKDLYGNELEPVELHVIRKQIDPPFLSQASMTAHSGSGKKPRSSSQRGHNRRRGDDQLSPSKPLTDEYGRMTRSELGPISGIKSPPRTSKLFRRKRTQAEERTVLAEQVNGFRGGDALDDLLVYIEGEKATKKSQIDQQQQQTIKKTKKKSSSECGTNTTTIVNTTTTSAVNNNNGSNNQSTIGGNTRKEKIRRSTEGDDGTSTFAALKSGNAASGGTLTYKHRSTDSLGLSYNEEDRRPFVTTNAGKSTASDDGMGSNRRIFQDDAATAAANEEILDVDPLLDSDLSMAQHLQMEEIKALENDQKNTGENLTTSTSIGDDEQFIPVTNKKQKKNKMEQHQFRHPATVGGATRYGRNTRNRTAVENTKRSVTPPARETATASGRRRRNSCDYVSSADLKRSPTINESTTGPAKETILTKADSADAATGTGATTMASLEISDPSDMNKPSYANVAAAHRHFHSPPNLGDFVSSSTSPATMNKQKFNKKRTNYHRGARDNRTTRDDGHGSGSQMANRQSSRQASSLNASRSSSPVNIPTAVATNLANASSPDLKHFTGESLIGGGQPPRRTYATIAADKRFSSSTNNSTQFPISEFPPTSSMMLGEKEILASVADIETMEENREINEQEKNEIDHQQIEKTSGDNFDETSTKIDVNIRKCVTDTAVNTEPFISTTTNVEIPTTTMTTTTTNLGDSAFIFEQSASTSETKATIIRKSADRSSCSGVFDSSDKRTNSNVSQDESTDSKMNSNSMATASGNGNNRERRNSCPVQFLDKVGFGLDVKSLNASGLNFVFGDEEDNEEINAALARSATISFPQTTTEKTDTSMVNEVDEASISKEEAVKTDSVVPVLNEQREQPNLRADNPIPDRRIKEMANFVSKAWADFTKDASSTVYYNNVG